MQLINYAAFTHDLQFVTAFIKASVPEECSKQHSIIISAIVSIDFRMLNYRLLLMYTVFCFLNFYIENYYRYQDFISLKNYHTHYLYHYFY